MMDRLRKLTVKLGRFSIHVDFLGLIAFFALALTVWSVTRVSYSISNEGKDRAKLEAAILDARYRDCVASNTTRKALTDVVEAQNKLLSSKQSRALILKLQLPESLLKQSEAVRAFELKALAQKNCNVYTNQANPKRSH